MVDRSNFDLCELVITAPDPDWLLEFTCGLVAARLASNVHNFTPVRSCYHWDGRVHNRIEGRAALHTRFSLVATIVQRVKDEHPYEVPSVSARPILDGSQDYLEWILAVTEGAPQ